MTTASVRERAAGQAAAATAAAGATRIATAVATVTATATAATAVMMGTTATTATLEAAAMAVDSTHGAPAAQVGIMGGEVRAPGMATNRMPSCEGG